MSATAEPMERTKKVGKKARETAESLAGKQREISVSEFFAKNRHLLGFDNPRKALLTTIKEAVDNALDACEEAGILPDIYVEVVDLARESGGNEKGKGNEGEETGGKGGKGASASSRYRVIVQDNGPGIVRKQIEHIFGRLLYGSKFHRLKMSRGQQGIGISAAGMYGLMTTGKPVLIVSKTGVKKPAHEVVLKMDTSKNRAEVVSETEHPEDDPMFPHGHGTRVVIELEGKYQKGRGSVDEYLELTGIANPHARIEYVAPMQSGDTAPARVEFPRAVEELPPEAKEIQPHPHGIELGILIQMLERTESSQLSAFLQSDFCRVGGGTAKDICDRAGLSQRMSVKKVGHAEAERVYAAIQEAKIMSPPTDCLSPIGPKVLLKGLEKGLKPDFIAVSSRPAAVYRGRPFLIEAGVAYGGDLPGDETARVHRFANRVPLQYQQAACASFKAVTETDWKRYGLQQPRGSLPTGPLVVMIHMASVWVPFTSESKEAIADYDEIRKEMRLALQECGRKLGAYLNRRQRMKREGERRNIFERYIGEVAKACETITGTPAQKVYEALYATAMQKTAQADETLDEEGRVVKREEALEEDETVFIREGTEGGDGEEGQKEGKPAKRKDDGALFGGEEGESAGESRVKRKRAGSGKKKGVKERKRAADSPTAVKGDGARGGGAGGAAVKKKKPKYRYLNDGRIVPVEDEGGLF
ncbi:MAG: DNA topoisomerase VI subunit B [Phycisphaerales bacterium]